MKTKVILTVLALIATIGLISAQNTKAETSKSASKKTCYVDANTNNVCDNYENKTCTQGNGKGLRDGSRRGTGQGLQNGNGNNKGNRNSQGFKSGNGKGANYVDVNKNGTCDYREVTK